MKRLRALQYEYNKRKSAQLEIDYKRGLQVPTIRWIVNEADMRKRAAEVDLNNLYRDAFLCWKKYYNDESEFQRFGTAPVRNAYWGVDGLPQNAYIWRGIIKRKNSPTMVFRRFNCLMTENERLYYGLDILVKALLGFQETVGWKSSNNSAILGDAWTVNLRSTEKENIMMDSFLRGFGPELKKEWEGKAVIGVDVSEELKDLFKVYTDAEDHLRKKEAEALSTLTSYMKRFLDVQDERKKVLEKLNTLTAKLKSGQSPDDEQDDDEDEEE